MAASGLEKEADLTSLSHQSLKSLGVAGFDHQHMSTVEPSSSDFVLFPPNFNYASLRRSKMLAIDAARPKQSTYFQPMTMDPSLVDMFAYPMEVPAYHPHTHSHTDFSRVPQSYYESPSLFAESADFQKASTFSSMPATPPSVSASYSAEYQIPTGSAASGPSVASAPSSAIGSPYSGTAQLVQDNWMNTNHGLGLPAAVMNDLFSNGYMGSTVDMDGLYQEKFPDTFVDPSLIQPVQSGPGFTPTISYPDQSTYAYPTNFASHSPAASPVPSSDNLEPQRPSALMMFEGSHPGPVSAYDRRSSISSIHSRRSQRSPALSSVEADDEVKEKGRCPHPDCGRVFKDLKAHMLTHQPERPEKCPIMTCEYHTKGFARKYDKNRHTLTHYKGTMVCGFCPGSGSPAEKSFNRADVFKRHLTSVHGVEQTPPNCRKRSPSNSNKGTNYGSDATGKCSTCSATFSNAQDFYEHLDDCVLRVVQQEEPSEAINQQRLAEVAADEEVKKTMEKHQLLDAAGPVDALDDNDSHDDDDSHDPSSWRAGRGAPRSTKATGPSSRPIIGSGNAVSKPGANAPGKNGARAVATRRRNNRGNYPQSWGCPNSSMKTKKRVLCVFDGQRRLWKDEMMLNNEFEVRLRLPGGAGDGTHRDAYVTDLDVETMKRVEGVHSANEEERGPWIEGPASHLMGQPAMLLPEMCQAQDDEISLNELMA
ncbi:uncharacterized protein N7482_008935 [Penicillium canariense]|uniref:C2H2-type domain-containing protein n=1 Tax=Penicillium canariense TaxID=189055 RepID=A0A9W9HWX3_9EURO|nr:uncharacterized protein N7482_008935 [Penicillium canariense]KAJ5157835.1 hypothetical protein N7482_008935 [Penicillium canariense]